MNIAQRIFELLKIQSKKQSELAEYVGISRAAISDWKSKGTSPTAEYLVKICEFLDISLDYLLTGVEPMPKELAPDEVELVELYRKLEPTERLEHRAELKGYIRAKGKTKS